MITGIELKTMTLNDVKKALYREKPIAKTEVIDGYGNLTLSAKLQSGKAIKFYIPCEESMSIQGDLNNMPAQLLIRWIYNF